MIDRTWELLGVGSVIGAEEPLLRMIQELALDAGLRIHRSPGVLEVRARGARDSTYALSAHVDRHGLIGLGAGEFGYAAHVRREDLHGESSHATRSFLRSVSERFDGEPMQAYDPRNGRPRGAAMAEHLTDVDRGLIIHIDALADLPAGTPVAYLPPGRQDRSGNVLSGQLDNAICVAMAVELLRSGVAQRVFFTREEEIGRSADHLLAHLSDEPDWPSVLVLDTSPFPTDRPARSASVVLRTCDAGGEFAPEIVEHLTTSADALGIEVVIKNLWIEEANVERERLGQKPLGFGRTELGRLVESSGGRLHGGTVQLPTCDYHTSRESTTTQAVDAMLHLLDKILGA